MAKKYHVFLLLFLLSTVVLKAQEFQINGVAGYSRTYKWYGGVDMKGVFHVDNTDFKLNLEALTANTYSIGLTAGHSFKVCEKGFVFLDGTLHSRIFGRYKTYEFVYAASAGFRMRHFSVQAGLFSRIIDAFGRDWHSLQNYVTEPFNFLYKVIISVMGFDHPWDVYLVGANYNDYEYERMWEPICSLGGRWDFKERWRAVAEGTLQAAGMFHGTVKFYEMTLRVGVVYKLK